jgi:hypothetical protein
MIPLARADEATNQGRHDQHCQRTHGARAPGREPFFRQNDAKTRSAVLSETTAALIERDREFADSPREDDANEADW